MASLRSLQFVESVGSCARNPQKVLGRKTCYSQGYDLCTHAYKTTSARLWRVGGNGRKGSGCFIDSSEVALSECVRVARLQSESYGFTEYYFRCSRVVLSTFSWFHTSVRRNHKLLFCTGAQCPRLRAAHASLRRYWEEKRAEGIFIDHIPSMPCRCRGNGPR